MGVDLHMESIDVTLTLSFFGEGVSIIRSISLDVLVFRGMKLFLSITDPFFPFWDIGTYRLHLFVNRREQLSLGEPHLFQSNR